MKRTPEDDYLKDEGWSNATWGWIAGIAVIALVLVFAFGGK